MKMSPLRPISDEYGMIGSKRIEVGFSCQEVSIAELVLFLFSQSLGSSLRVGVLQLDLKVFGKSWHLR